MAYEIEMKFRLAGVDQLAARLAALGASPSPAVVERDLYWNHPARDFAQTGEAFRIRRVGDSNRVTYKGPRRAGPAKIREEIEIPFADGAATFDQLQDLLARLGFAPVGLVEKTRTTHQLADGSIPIVITLDQVAGLGAFAEIEVVAATAAGIPAAQAAVIALSESLGLTELEPRSYLRMTLEARSGTSPRAFRQPV